VATEVVNQTCLKTHQSSWIHMDPKKVAAVSDGFTAQYGLVRFGVD
jgi:hypothetical protein